MSDWYPPTYADLFKVDPATIVNCPACGRRTAAEMIYDLSSVDLSEAALARLKSSTLGCDACRETLLREGLLTRAKCVTDLGAPQEIVDCAQAVDAREASLRGDVQRIAAALPP